MTDLNFLFDDDYCMEICIKGHEILLYISEDLNIVEKLSSPPDKLKEKIYQLVESFDDWFLKASKKIKSEFNNKQDLCLLNIYILTEPENSLIFGLEFTIESDREHGRGMKINADTLEIIEYGFADVAFC